MIKIQASGLSPEDLTGMDQIRILGKIAEHNAAGRIVTVSFGAEPKYLVRKHCFYRLTEIQASAFAKQLASQENEYTPALFDGTEEEAA